MVTLVRAGFLFIVLFIFSLVPALPAETPSQSLENWKPYAQRPALMPKMEIDRQSQCLVTTAIGEFRCNGAWVTSFPVSANRRYKIHIEYQATDVRLPRRSILATVDWQNAEEKRVEQPEFPPLTGKTADGWKILEGNYPAPAKAVSAAIDLIFRWSETGSVRWRNITFTETEAPKSRTVTVATVNFRPRNTSGPEENLKQFAAYLKQAGEQKADIVCLPEGITVVGNGKSMVDAAELVPGSTTRFLGQIAKEYSMYIVGGIYERVGETVYNTAVLIGRKGELVGAYRKASLPREEIEGGITPGDDFPVYATDFGKVGMMICWDVHFVEPARRLARNGAEIILMPIWGGVEPLFPARAIENQVYLVTSSYDARTGLWNREGKVIAEALKNGSIAVGKIDLEVRTLWPWLGDYCARIPREGPPVRE